MELRTLRSPNTGYLVLITRFSFRACVLLMVVCALVQFRDKATAADSTDVPTALAGIVHFTRWADLRATVHACVDEDSRASSGFRAVLAQDAHDKREIVVVSLPGRIPSVPFEQLLDCQMIYFGAATPNFYRPLLLKLAGRPILTVGSGDDFCSYGGLFCLESASEGMRIKANLDSIAISGLRVNPQLLRLTQRARGTR